MDTLSLRFSPYFGSNNNMIKSCRFARECVFICASMDVTTQLELCFHEQTRMVANVACIVGS